MIKQEQYQTLTEKGVNVSGLIRDLLDDYLSDHKVTLAVSEETHDLYEKIVSNTGANDSQLEVYLRDSLRMLLKDKIKEMQDLQKNAFE